MRSFGIIFAVTLAAGGTLDAATGYLPRVGPTPIRFFKSIPRSDRAVLPPLRMTNKDSAPPTVLAALETFVPRNWDEIVAGQSYGFFTNSAATGEAAGNPASTSGDSAFSATGDTNAVISPQMFMRFFVPSTRKPGVVVTTPDFTPAHPATQTPGSSSATYSSPSP
jgi:hypothetical protein